MAIDFNKSTPKPRHIKKWFLFTKDNDSGSPQLYIHVEYYKIAEPSTAQFG